MLCYLGVMKLSQYAKSIGVSYKTVYRMWKAGKLDAYQLPSGTVVVRESVREDYAENAALYCRVSAEEGDEAVEKQLDRLRDFAMAKGYTVVKEVVEVASALEDNRPRLNRLLADPQIRVIVVEYRGRLARYGFSQISQLLESQGRRVEPVEPTEPDNELASDFQLVLTSLALQLYGRKNGRYQAQKIRHCLEECLSRSLPTAAIQDEELNLELA